MREHVELRLHTSGHPRGSTIKDLRAIVEGAVYDLAPDLMSLTILAPEEESSSGFVPLQSLLKQSLVAHGAEVDERGLRMSAPGTPSFDQAFATLRQFARSRPPAERCELCSTGLAHEHPHLVEISLRQIICACEACATLFDGMANGKYRRVSRRAQFLVDFKMTDAQWENLYMPINMAFFFQSSVEGKVVALYPSPAGAVESLLSLDAWNEIVQENPILAS